MSRTPEEAERYMLEIALKTYRLPAQRAAMRSALGDASGLADSIATDIKNAGMRNGRIKKRAIEDALLVTRVATAIWSMREKIKVHEDQGE